MVRIKFSPSKKRYLKGKNIYDYIRGHMPIPKKILTRLEPYFSEDFHAEMTEDSNRIALTYSFLKRKNQENPSAPLKSTLNSQIPLNTQRRERVSHGEREYA